MKRFVHILIVLLLQCCSYVSAQESLTVMSYNIRLDVASDGENRWDARKDKVAALMNYYAADFIGEQEVQHHQLQYLLAQLPQYGYIGVGRDDGKEAGEYSCIFYNKEKFEVLQQSTFWLSTTPDTVSFGWNAACRRVCTWGLFRNRKTKKELLVLNTHLDHMGDTAREESAKLITQRIGVLNKNNRYPVIITGDFNSKPAEAPALYMTAHFQNARSVSTEKPYGPADTWNGFAFNKIPEGCIDYIFTSTSKKITVQKFATVTDSYDMKYPSDHFPVLATISIAP